MSIPRPPQTRPFQRRDSSRNVANRNVSDDIPPQSAQDHCASIPIYSADGASHRFDSLYAGSNRRDLIIFVRHFFCGMCQDFLVSLNAALSPSDLAALPTPTTLTIIGCGDPALIKDYATNTSCAFPIYADPGREIYDNYAMTSTLDKGEKPDYQTSSLFGVVTKSIASIVSAGPWNVFKGGSFVQVGGDFLLENGKPVWCHRMRSTRDHTDIPKLKQLLHVEKTAIEEK